MSKLTQQSPIDLRNPVVTDFGPNGLDICWTDQVHGRIEPKEDGLHVKFDGDTRQFIQLDQSKFHLVEFHFHHPSEHWVEGHQYPVELHIVHQNVSDGRRAVLGVFIDGAKSKKVGGKKKGKKAKASRPELLSQIKALCQPNSAHDGIISTNPHEFLPDDTEHYYRYEGSLTTGKFDENVSWVVFPEPRYVAKEDLDELIVCFGEHARLPQPLNRRFVLANF
jgi:carbonic anhydrase